MTGSDRNATVVVFTTSDQVTTEVRRIPLADCALVFAETEDALYRRTAEGARLVLLQGSEDPEVARLAGRLMRAVPHLRAPLIALYSTPMSPTNATSISPLLDDVLWEASERWQVLLQTWARFPDSAARRVAAIRLLHQCAPAELVPLFDSLVLTPEALLSVKHWSAQLGMSRASLHRHLRDTRMQPSELIDVVRALHVVSPVLLERGGEASRLHRGWGTRTNRRVLARTIGLPASPSFPVDNAQRREYCALIAERLRQYFRRVTPPSVSLRGMTLVRPLADARFGE